MKQFDYDSLKNLMYVNSRQQIAGRGWHNQDNSDNEKTTFYAEHKNSEPGYAVEAR